MSEKTRARLDWTWNKLHYCNVMYGRFCTAGELAQEMGISRNTAQKYLRELIACDTVTWKPEYGKNKQTKITYNVVTD